MEFEALRRRRTIECWSNAGAIRKQKEHEMETAFFVYMFAYVHICTYMQGVYNEYNVANAGLRVHSTMSLRALSVNNVGNCSGL